MIRGITDSGNIKTAKMTEDGALKVAMEGDNSTEINNPDTSPIPVKVTEKETTLKSNILNIGTTSEKISFVENITFTDRFGNKHTLPVPEDDSLFSSNFAIRFFHSSTTDTDKYHIYVADTFSSTSANPTSGSIRARNGYKTYELQNNSYILIAEGSSGNIDNLGATLGQMIYFTVQPTLDSSGNPITSVEIGENFFDIPYEKNITSIDIANYSDTANITLTAGELEATIGNNIAVTLPINKELKNISLVSTEDDTPVQIVIKGVE